MPIRKPRWAAQFYPEDPREAQKLWDGFFQRCSQSRIEEPIRAIQVPHAGWVYSGQCAAEAYNQLKKRTIETVVMIGPQHHVTARSIQVFPEGMWESPLGNLRVNSEITTRFLDYDPMFQVDISAHQAEHSLEVQIAPIASVLPEVKIVPLLMPPYRGSYARILSKALAKIVGKNPKITVLVSTDLYHGESYNDCKESDDTTISYVSALDASGLARALGSGEASACGGDGLIAFLGASKDLGINKSHLLAAYNSNDIMGVRGGYVVGYSSFAFTGG